MDSINTFVTMDEEKLAEARALDKEYDLWTARMIRWVKFKIAPKSFILGPEWDNQQYKDHKHENVYGRLKKYMPGAPTDLTWGNLPSHCTDSASLSTAGQYWREKLKYEAKQAAAKEKFDAGLELSRSEADAYENWVTADLWRQECEADAAKPKVEEEEIVAADIHDGGFEDSKNEINNEGFEASNNECDTNTPIIKNESADIWTPAEFKDSNNECDTNISIIKNESAVDWALAEYVQPNWRESPESVSSITSFKTGETSAYGLHPGRCTRSLGSITLRYEYLKEYRGIYYSLPGGIGLHVQRPPYLESICNSITHDDALDNLPGNLSYVYRPNESINNNPEQDPVLMIESAPEKYKDEKEDFRALYDRQLCHRDNSWLAKVNPEITPEMMAAYKAEVERNKNEAVKTLELLKQIGKNLDLLAPMMHIIMRDPKLCQAIHAELVKRDIGFLKTDDDKKFRFHGRVETVFANLDRWASEDIESAIEDVRLILEDHELLHEIIDALNGGETQRDRPLIDPKPFPKPCAQCGRDLKELGVIYGRDDSTLMATGCRLCEDTRLRRAKRLLWKWYKHPEELDDDQYKKIFSVEKGFEWPEEEDRVEYGDDDEEEECEEEEEEEEEAVEE